MGITDKLSHDFLIDLGFTYERNYYYYDINTLDDMHHVSQLKTPFASEIIVNPYLNEEISDFICIDKKQSNEIYMLTVHYGVAISVEKIEDMFQTYLRNYLIKKILE